MNRFTLIASGIDYLIDTDADRYTITELWSEFYWDTQESNLEAWFSQQGVLVTVVDQGEVIWAKEREN